MGGHGTISWICHIATDDMAVKNYDYSATAKLFKLYLQQIFNIVYEHTGMLIYFQNWQWHNDNIIIIYVC